MKRIKDIIDIIDGLNRDYAAVAPPASSDDIERVNQELKGLTIPSGLVDFFMVCGGLEYNGMVIYGTQDSRIVSHNDDRHDYYEEFTHLLFFGSIDDDIYTYNTQTERYESRDINGMECWDEYDSFEKFFHGEMLQWLN